jgi:UDP-glucose-4-epimerase GalE
MCHELGMLYPDCQIYGIDKHDKRHLRHLYDHYDNVDLALDPISLPENTDAIFHFAAYTSVEEGEMRPFEYYHNNVVGSLRLIKRAIEGKVPHFIFSSTAAVYGTQKNPMFGHLFESTTPNPFSVYGKTKHIVEQVLQDEKQIKSAILRYFNVAGRSKRANLYEEHDPETHLIPLLVRDKNAVIFGNDYPTKDGTAVRDFIDVRDICRAHTLAYRHMEQTQENLLLNVGSGKGYSVKEVVDKVNSIIHNGEMNIECKEQRAGDVPYLVADTTKSKEILGFDPQYNLDQIIESMKNG